VDELMAQCDRLEAQIIAGDESSGRLLDSLRHEALAISEVPHVMKSSGA
jgi:hypothetical protein